jgi:hypothetical protein
MQSIKQALDPTDHESGEAIAAMILAGCSNESSSYGMIFAAGRHSPNRRLQALVLCSVAPNI